MIAEPLRTTARALSLSLVNKLVGVEDEYARKHDSLLNRMKEKQAEAVKTEPKPEPAPEQEKAPDIAEGSEKGAGAGEQ